ncbi:MAG: homocysteine S-methyltransferase family protein [Alphaproteobacteria bacterium]|nr:homocysteine S-methyltransferase family protein [Alphaproteobacteria bacterium]
MPADTRPALTALMADRILVLEGAMGTMIQAEKLDESGYRGSQFADHGHHLRGNNDLLNLTQPAVIERIHDTYLAIGSDLIETNTFNATTISQSDYGCEPFVHNINLDGARIARRAADRWTEKTPEKPRYVIGNLGPTNRTCSISPDVNRPGFRAVTFEEMRKAYHHQAKALFEGGVDCFAVETVFDTLNCKAALFALEQLADETGVKLPVMVTGTVTDLTGRNLSGQTVTAFWYAVRHADPVAFGLNCGFGAEQLRPFVEELARECEVPLVVYPNAGLPNELGAYDEAPAMTARLIREWAEEGLVNIVGGCCGTTPDHIQAIAEAVKDVPPRQVPADRPRLRLSGLDPFVSAA